MKTTIFKTSILALFAFLFAACTSPSAEQHVQKVRLTFGENGKFKIVQFTDLHMYYGEPNTVKTLETVKTILAAEKPDVAVLTGDIVLATPDSIVWMDLAKVFEEARTPFAVAFGNHDGERKESISRSGIIDILQQSPYFLGEQGPKDIPGECNYVVPVYGRDNHMAALLYCFDSNSYSSNPRLSGYDPVHFDQIAWYRRKSEQLTAANGGKPLPALAFFHIPLPEYGLVAQRLFPNAGRIGSPGPSYNTGLFGSFLEMNDVMGVFVGHLHGNDYIGIEKYIALGYGRCTGWSAGGRIERGARIIELYENEFVFDTWLRTAKGVEQSFYFPTGITSMDKETMTYLPAKDIKPTKQGVLYTYHEGRFGSVREIDTAKIIDKGVMKYISVAETPVKYNYAFEFKALIHIPERDVYSFYSVSDDDSQIYIDEQLIVNKLGSPITRIEGKVALEAGFHEMRVRYRQDAGGRFLEVGYATKDIRSRKVPEETLYLIEN